MSLNWGHRFFMNKEMAMSRSFKVGVLAAAVMAVAPAAQAFEAGDFVVRAVLCMWRRMIPANPLQLVEPL